MSALPGLVRLPKGPERQFGKYALVVKLGWGGMADVYLAVPQGQDPKWDESLVVKRLKADLAFDSEYRAMFKDESKLALRLEHPNIVRASEMGEVDGQPYLAMEFLDGQPLDKVLESTERLTRAEILQVMSGLLAGLHHAHELRDDDGSPLDIVHRDVSPHNVFLTYGGQVKLVDFGIAKSRVKAQHTMTGVVKGKIAYMAPEQALASTVDKRADVFAAGVILWELIVGKPFWGECSDVQILKTMTFGELPKIEDHLPNASQDLISICGKALAVTADQRYASAAEFKSDVDRFIAKIGEPVSAAELGRTVSRVAGEKRRALEHVIEQQFGRRSLIIREDTPPGLELPANGTKMGLGPANESWVSDASVDEQAPRSGARRSGSSGGFALRATQPDERILPSAPASIPPPSARESGRGGSSDSSPDARRGELASTLDPVSARGRLGGSGSSGSDHGSRSGARRGSKAPSFAPPPTWQASTRRSRPWPWIAMAGVIAVGVGIFGLKGFSRTVPPEPTSLPQRSVARSVCCARKRRDRRERRSVGSGCSRGSAVCGAGGGRGCRCHHREHQRVASRCPDASRRHGAQRQPLRREIQA